MALERNKTDRQETLLLVAASDTDANMLYATQFFAPDPFIFFQHRGRKYMVMSDLEIDRAKKQAEVDRVISLSAYQARLRARRGSGGGVADVLDFVFKERHIRALAIPANFPTLLA